MITDSQVHIWEVDRPDRPWPQPPRNEPQLPNGFSVAEMLAEMDRAGIDRAVIVPPTWIGEGNETALDVAHQHPKRFAIMGRIDVKRPDLKDAMATWKQQPGMLGVRHTFRTQPYRGWLGRRRLRALLGLRRGERHPGYGPRVGLSRGPRPDR